MICCFFAVFFLLPFGSGRVLFVYLCSLRLVGVFCFFFCTVNSTPAPDGLQPKYCVCVCGPDIFLAHTKIVCCPLPSRFSLQLVLPVCPPRIFTLLRVVSYLFCAILLFSRPSYVFGLFLSRDSCSPMPPKNALGRSHDLSCAVAPSIASHPP